MGIVTTSSATAFTQPAETVYDFVTNPVNWTKTYPGSNYVGKLDELPLKVGDTWEEGGPDGERIFTWHLAMAVRPTLWMFTSVGRLGHDREGNGGMEGRITVQYHFTHPAPEVTLFIQDHDRRSAQTRTDARRLLPDRQPREHRQVSRRDPAGARLTHMQRPSQRRTLLREQLPAHRPLRGQGIEAVNSPGEHA